ncbi:MAG: hypothetical protein A2W23_05645 [Planctomycetes bacterium RBG_16_43_13]|nr:MAG: hypothetical protein A2W23_05645 [Planctomycetes bacterium RBG_16_43_13]
MSNILRSAIIANFILLSVITTIAQDNKKADEPRTGAFEEEDASTKIMLYYYVPKDYNPKEKYAVFVGNHGAGGSGKQLRDLMMRYIREEKKAEEGAKDGENKGEQEKEPKPEPEKNWIIVCPTSPGCSKGNAGKTVSDAPVVATAAKNTIDNLSKMYNIDKKHILAMGFSGGGYAVVSCFNKYPDTFTAMAACSINYGKSVGNAIGGGNNNRHVLVVYGEKDLSNIIAGAKRLQTDLKDNGYSNTKIIEIPGMGHKFGEAVIKEIWKWWDEEVTKVDKKKGK